MNRKCRLIFTGAVAILLLITGCAGKTIPEVTVVEPEPIRTSSTEGSLWPGLTPNNMLFSDNKASRVGDIITIHLVEETIASNRATTKTARDVSNKFGMDTGSGAPTEFDFSGGQGFTGSGSTSRSNKLTATISVLVTEVLANGYLKVDGRRKLKINNEEQYIKVTGIIRPQDVNFDNSILSTKVANAEIVYDGVGDIDKNQRANWLGKTLNKIWPF